jgi:hypothetical protein
VSETQRFVPPADGGEEAGERALRLSPRAVATISADRQRDVVVLSIVDGAGPAFTVEIPSRAASELAVVLVNAANGL